eukprot:3484574-Amphidinium_carterae.1
MSTVVMSAKWVGVDNTWHDAILPNVRCREISTTRECTVVIVQVGLAECTCLGGEGGREGHIAKENDCWH